mmetsp:Transcript_10430/g.18825  ORF Transcript_10430/g.18825 Transcript_10430/m.18825 type:complete len:85 (+) Transcript_10430:512-766(+)
MICSSPYISSIDIFQRVDMLLFSCYSPFISYIDIFNLSPSKGQSSTVPLSPAARTHSVSIGRRQHYQRMQSEGCVDTKYIGGNF